jgi:ribosomal protein S18 acetylase RimI-like enzyme
MLESLNIVSAASVSVEEFAVAFNKGFEDYFYPMSLNGATLSQRICREQINPYLSLLAYSGEEFFGMAMLGTRGSAGWIGGFGIAKRFRGQGRAHELMNAIIEQARNAGLQTLQLEVLAQNTAGIRLYERAGMSVMRDLIILERKSGAMSAQQAASLAEGAPESLLEHFARLHKEKAAWQRDLATLLVFDNQRGFYLGPSDRPDAYALLSERPNGIIYITDVAAADDNHAQALCEALASTPAEFRILNEPEGSLLLAPLFAHGFCERTRQREMIMEL